LCSIRPHCSSALPALCRDARRSCLDTLPFALPKEAPGRERIMTKKIRAGNKGARRSKPKTLKRVELVRPEGLSPGEEPQKRHVPEDKPFELANASAVIATPEKTEEDQMRILKGSAYTRGATRRATQKALQRKPSAIIT